MVVERIPGEKVYIDWIGDQPEILVNTATGEIKKVHFFVTTVGVSNLIFAEPFEDEKLPNFIAGTVHAEACLARLLNDAYRLEMNGKNMRNIEPINKQS